MDKHRIHLADGHQFTLHSMVPASARALIYWCPALGVPGRKYQRLADALSQHGIGLLSHEWRGTDTSNVRAARSHDWRYQALFADIDAGLQYAREHWPNVPIWLGGHSLGSQLALLQLARDQTAAGAIIVAGGSPYWRTYPWLGRPMLFLAALGFPLIGKLIGHYPGQKIGFAGREARGVMAEWGRSALTGHYRLRNMDADLESRLNQDTRPVLAVHVAQDQYVPHASLDYLVNKAGRAKHQRINLGTHDFPSGKADHFSWMREPEPIAVRLAAAMFADGVDVAPLRQTA
ncbi:alpha/beta hydrolase [Ahniella affigens]|uniref:Alpha/beta hydrolase n=1 Tax=Ahniella affigens TaxID=2021234 RepID=A0A2P1PU74_9GAMM|nr:alpha/beta fold hydrolase [Ahniella affigens]AVP98380.1 alpha/beta hydrolase [Ahniella affigens]